MTLLQIKYYLDLPLYQVVVYVLPTTYINLWIGPQFALSYVDVLTSVLVWLQRHWLSGDFWISQTFFYLRVCCFLCLQTLFWSWSIPHWINKWQIHQLIFHTCEFKTNLLCSLGQLCGWLFWIYKTVLYSKTSFSFLQTSLVHDVFKGHLCHCVYEYFILYYDWNLAHIFLLFPNLF